MTFTQVLARQEGYGVPNGRSARIEATPPHVSDVCGWTGLKPETVLTEAPLEVA